MLNQIKKQSQFTVIMKRLLKNKMAILGLVIIGVYILIAAFAAVLTPYEMTELNLAEINMSPSLAHLCGTDEFGRDILTRLFFGTRYSLAIGLGSTLLGLVLGIALGCLSGYFGGWVEEIIMRLCDMMQAIPSILLAIVISVVLGTGVVNTIIALGIGRIPLNCRMIRAQFLSLRGMEYIEAAQATNCPIPRQMLIHMLPNAISPLIVTTTMGIGVVIMMAASLSFINLGVRPPLPEWGAMISAAKETMRSYPYQIIALESLWQFLSWQ